MSAPRKITVRKGGGTLNSDCGLFVPPPDHPTWWEEVGVRETLKAKAILVKEACMMDRSKQQKSTPQENIDRRGDVTLKCGGTGQGWR